MHGKALLTQKAASALSCKIQKKTCRGEREDPKAAAEEGIRLSNEFFASLGMPLSLGELLGRRLTDEEIDALALECSYDRTRKIGRFKTLDYDDMRAIYKACR